MPALLENVAFQASELASSIQSRRDLGCQASEIVHLEEGVSCDSSLAADFWRLLGGRTQYRGKRSNCRLCKFLLIVLGLEQDLFVHLQSSWSFYWTYCGCNFITTTSQLIKISGSVFMWTAQHVFLFASPHRSQCRRGGWALWARSGGVQLCVQAGGEQTGALWAGLGLHPQCLPTGLHWGLRSLVDSPVAWCWLCVVFNLS